MLKESFGVTSEGKEASIYTLENANKMVVKVTDYGASIVSIIVPDKAGNMVDVVLGYDDVAGYEAGTNCFGATVARNANRIGGATFEINGKVYELVKNDNGNNLHSGPDLSYKRFWSVESYENQKIVMYLDSPDGDQGYPGNVRMYVTFSLSDDNALVIDYLATPDQDTILNLTNHSYFNLNGHDSGLIYDHQAYIESDAFTQANAESIPTGVILPVEGTPMDFRTIKTFGLEIDSDYQTLVDAGGYDHNWVLNQPDTLRVVAECVGNLTEIKMQVLTDLPGMQVYTGNYVNHDLGKNGVYYERRSGVCFETQYYPDAPHHSNFPSSICKANETYKTTTVYKFI